MVMPHFSYQSFTNLSDPVWQPAQDVHSYDCKYQFGDLPVGIFLLFRFVHGPHSFQFAYDEQAKHENGQKGNSEPQYEGGEGKDGLTADTFTLVPQDVARRVSHNIGVPDDGHHEESDGNPSRQTDHL
jgi:hypothetical protein